MLKCVRIIISYDPTLINHSNTFPLKVQTHAQLFVIEGSLQHLNNGKTSLKIIACGTKDNIDNFMDALYKELADNESPLEIEPFMKEKDYRGVFRLIL